MNEQPKKRPNLRYMCSDYKAPPKSQEYPYHKSPTTNTPGTANVTESEHQSKFPEEYVVPQRSSWADIPREHLTIRERYAMAALQGMLSNSNLDIREIGDNWICDRAWEIAEEHIQWQDYDAQKRMERAFRRKEVEAGEDEELSERDDANGDVGRLDAHDRIRRVNRTLASAREECRRLAAELERERDASKMLRCELAKVNANEPKEGS